MLFARWDKKVKKFKEEMQSDASQILHTLSGKGIVLNEQELTDEIERNMKTIEMQLSLPEELTESQSAELEATNSGYKLSLSLALANGAGNSKGLEIAMRLAALYASISEISRKSGISHYVLKCGQKIAVCDPKAFAINFPHPILSLVPTQLMKISLMR